MKLLPVFIIFAHMQNYYFLKWLSEVVESLCILCLQNNAIHVNQLETMIYILQIASDGILIIQMQMYFTLQIQSV